MADSSAPQRDPDVVSYGSFTGVRNDVSPERFGPADLDLGDNVDIDNTGRLQRRAGRTLVSGTATHSLWADGDKLGFCVQGTTLMKLGLDLSLNPVMTGLTAGFPFSYRKVNDNVYFSNTREKGVWTPAGMRSWGLPVAPLPAVSLGLGALTPGTYQFVATYVRSDGQEGGAGVAGTFLVAAGLTRSVTFTLVPPVDPTIAYHNIYLSQPNGDRLYLALTVPVANTTASYAGNTYELSYDLKTQFLQAPPAGQIVGYYSGRVYVADGDVLYPSEPFSYELFDLRKYIQVNGRITMFGALEDKETVAGSGVNSGIFIGTDRTCGILVGSSPEEFQYVPKLDYGAIEGAVDYVDGSLYGDGAYGARLLPMWLTTAGLCLGIPGLEIRNITRNRYTFPAAGRGAAMFDSTPNRFVAVANF